ncbi:hypothetical protein C8R44DRAFT_768662 [Mycena epipterygia]|nr:hypothetical protein C8R44DRAFT_768662 [Mycena epipterygia]
MLPGSEVCKKGPVAGGAARSIRARDIPMRSNFLFHDEFKFIALLTAVFKCLFIYDARLILAASRAFIRVVLYFLVSSTRIVILTEFAVVQGRLFRFEPRSCVTVCSPFFYPIKLVKFECCVKNFVEGRSSTPALNDLPLIHLFRGCLVRFEAGRYITAACSF